MERIQSLNRCLLFFSLWVLGACATKVTPEQLADIRRNDEFEQAVKVQQIETPPVPVELPDELKKTEKKPNPLSPKPEKTKKKNGKASPAKKQQPPAQTETVEKEPEIGGVIERPEIDPFVVGHTSVMNVSFSGISAGEVELRVNPFLEVNGERAYHFSTHAKSNSLFSFFYNVDDWAETYVRHRDFLPLSFAIHVRESQQFREVRSFFDWEKMKAKYWEKTIRRGKKKEKNLTWDLQPYAQNVISAFFYLRLVPYEVGKKMAFRVADDGKDIVVHLETVAKEKISTEAGEFDAFKTKVRFEYNGVFKQTGDILVWTIDDPFKVIARLEAKIKLGTMSLVLKEIRKP